MRTYLQAAKGQVFRKVWVEGTTVHKLYVNENKFEDSIIHEHFEIDQFVDPETQEARFFELYRDASEITNEQFEAAYNRVSDKLKIS